MNFPVQFVGAGPGDPELLTLKAHRLLSECDLCVWAGSLIHPRILDALPPHAVRHDSAPLHLHQIVDLLREGYTQGKRVVRLHTGEPSVYGAIAEQMDLLDQYQIPYDQVPGISSFQAAAAALRVELTAPEVSQVVMLARVAGRTPVPADQELEKLAATRATLCLYLSTPQLASLCARLVPFYGPDCPAALLYKASWPDERIFKGTLSTLPALLENTGIGATALILVGHALQRPLSVASRLYAADFAHGARP